MFGNINKYQGVLCITMLLTSRSMYSVHSPILHTTKSSRTWFRLFLMLFLVWRRLISLDLSPSFFFSLYLDILFFYCLLSTFYFLLFSSLFLNLSLISPPYQYQYTLLVSTFLSPRERGRPSTDPVPLRQLLFVEPNLTPGKNTPLQLVQP